MKNKQEAIYYLSKKLWKHSEEKHILIIYSIIFIFSNIVLLAFPLLIANIVNIIQLEGLSSDNIYKILAWIGGYLVLELLFWALHGPARCLETINAFKVKAHYKMHLLKGVMNLPSSWHASHQSGDTIDKIEKGSDALYDYSEGGFMVIATFIKLLGATTILYFFNIPSGLIVTAIILITLFTIIVLDKPLIRNFHALNKMDNIISAKVYDTVSNINTVIILRLESLVTKSLLSKIMHPLSLFKKNVKQKEMKWFTISTLATFLIMATLGSYIITHLVTGEVLLIGSMMALYQYVHTIDNIFYHFCYRYGEIVKKKTDVENAEIIAHAFQNKSKIKQLKLAKTPWKQLILSKLSFRYKKQNNENNIKINKTWCNQVPRLGEVKSQDQRSRTAKLASKDTPHTLNLNNITIKKGEKIALIGESGAGKTTFLKIIRDLYTPQKINLTLDNTNLKQGFKQIAESISLIPQDPEIFASTIEDNITFGIKYKKDKIKKYTDMANFTKVIPELPNGLKSSINERGVNLSGGQKQRLALARGLLASETKEIVLLDEPTSSVDPTNELQIYQNIFKNFKKKTIISTIHKINLLPLFDRIFIFENGKIVETGSLKELKRKSKRFKKIISKFKSLNKN